MCKKKVKTQTASISSEEDLRKKNPLLRLCFINTKYRILSIKQFNKENLLNLIKVID